MKLVLCWAKENNPNETEEAAVMKAASTFYLISDQSVGPGSFCES